MTLKSNQPNGNKNVYAGFVLTKNNRKKEIGLNGQNARTLLTLIKVKQRGFRTYEGYTSDLPRLSWYICVLRHDYGINIITIREGERRTARYVLLDRVEVAKVWGNHE